MPERGIRIRLFLTGWIVLTLHFATDFSREHFLAVSIAEDHTFRLDKYLGLHDDIFEVPGRGAFQNANPGASMIAAIPYWICLPLVNAIDSRWASHPSTGPVPEFKDPRPARVKFYRMAREKGWHIRFGLAGAITTALCMAPLTAFSAVIVFQLLSAFGIPDRKALWLSFLYLFGTPVFFRAGYLNQNLLVGLFGLFSFFLLYRNATDRKMLSAAGFLAGCALLCDYSALPVLGILWIYACLQGSARQSLWYIAGAAPPVALLWFYQWICFGNPFLPPQHSMTEANPYALMGYQGFSFLSFELLRMLLIDPRIGLLVICPALALAFAAPFVRGGMGRRELVLCFSMFVALLVFFSCVQYTRIQWITGIRYMTAAIPFLFLPLAVVISRLGAIPSGLVAASMLVPAWCLAMVRSQAGAWDSVWRVMQGGPQLPWLTTLNRMTPIQHSRAIVIALFLATAAAICIVWRIRRS